MPLLQCCKRLHAAGSIGRGRAQQFAKLVGGAWRETAIGTARQPGNFTERLFAYRIVALLKHESRDIAQSQIAGTGAEVAAGLQALEDFNYDSLSVKIDEESNGAGTVLLALRGANPAVLSGQVFNFNIKLESNFDRLADLALQGMEATQTLLRRAAERNLPQ